MALALAVLLAWAAPAYGYAPNLPFNKTFSVIHPFLGWKPETLGAGNSSLWNTSFSDTPWSRYVPGMLGEGESEATFGNASEANHLMGFQFVFVGTAIAVHGHMEGQEWDPEKTKYPPMSFTIDDKSRTVARPNGTDIVHADGIPMAPHEIEVYIDQGSVTISGFSLAMGIESQACVVTWHVETSTQQWIVNGTRNDFFLYKGNWSMSTHIGGVGGQQPIEYDTLFHTLAEGPLSQTFFNIPRNTSMVMINGTVGHSYTERMDFDIVPVPPGKDLPGVTEYVSMNNAWTAPDAILYLAALDPTVEYSVTISQTETYPWNASSPNDVGLHSVTFYNALSNVKPASPDVAPVVAPARGMSRGQIAGAVVGAIVGAALIAAVAFVVAGKLIRRRQQKLRHGDPSTFVVDDGDEVAPIPYAGTASPMAERKGADPLPAPGPSPRPPPRPRRVQQEFDAGAAADDDIDYIPPQYDPQWSRPRDAGPSNSPQPSPVGYAQLKTDLFSPITPPAGSPDTDTPSPQDAYEQLKSDLLSPTSPAAPSPFAANPVPGTHAQHPLDLLSPAAEGGYSQSQLHSAALFER